MSCVYIRLYKTASITKSLSGRVHPKGCLEITKSLSGRTHFKDALKLLNP